ncbi:helix-turn-helix domain-containing protein [Uliginosibacterium gangwonense]|uniref:helix-turn-helix domain-containing protein n=1 Tax=Uliginosibacterium gangwonense TaxID=392736 RepID=UPI0003802DBA|nr:helix-turn-helix transcriptional regulator [Uliginosibacterium gangwonense]
MSEIDQLLTTLRRHLKAQGLTYRDLAARLGVSEQCVKRMFATQRFTLDRLMEISRILGFTLAELTLEASAREALLHTLSAEQERQLIANDKLLLVAVCMLNQWEVADIVKTYQISESECIENLLKLDRLRLLNLLPGNRVRLNVARDFDWLPGGPIRRFFQNEGLPDFVADDFSRPTEMMTFTYAMLTDAAVEKMQIEMRRLRQKLAELHEESQQSPRSKRHGTGLLVAMREWELGIFSALRRQVEA